MKNTSIVREGKRESEVAGGKKVKRSVNHHLFFRFCDVSSLNCVNLMAISSLNLPTYQSSFWMLHVK